MSTNKKNSFIQKKLFRETFLVMVCQELSQVGVGFIDGLIISIFLGSLAMAASGLTYPFFSIIGVFSGMMTLGTQKLFVDFLGKGDKEKARRVLSTALTVSIVIALVLFLLLFSCSGSVVRFLGARGNAESLYHDARNYLIGLSLGTPALILVSVLTPIAQAEGKTKSIALSLAAITTADIVLDLVMVKTGFAMLGMGLATSISQWLGLFILAVPMILKPIISPSLHAVDLSYLADILKIGLPKFVRRVCNTLRPIALNSIVIAIGGDVAMSAMSMRNNFSSITECFGEGLASTIILLSSLYMGERNKDALCSLRNSSKRVILGAEVLLAVIIMIFARPIARLYASDNQQVAEYLAAAIRCVALDTPMLALSESVQAYAQGIGELKRSNLLSILNRLIYLVASVFVFGKIFGLTGVWAAFPVTSLLTVITSMILEYIQDKKGGMQLLFPIPPKCNINDNDKIVRRVDAGEDSISEITKISEEIQVFCRQHGIDKRRSLFVALCYEEMACNIVQHNSQTPKRKISIDVFVAIIENKLYIRLRDNCLKFDAVEKYNTLKYDPEHPEKHIGIRLVMKSTESVEYMNTFGMNNLIITL